MANEKLATLQRRLVAQFGDLLEASSTTSTVDLEPYRSGPRRVARFAMEVLKVKALTRWFEHLCAEYEAGQRYLAIATCHSAGKTFQLQILALYAAFVERKVCVYASASVRQSRFQAGTTLKRLLDQGELKGSVELFVFGCSVPGGGMIAFTPLADVNSSQGWHHEAGLLELLDEFQHADGMLESAFANTTTQKSAVVVAGNPTRMSGDFANIFRLQEEQCIWWRRRVSAAELMADPNYDLIPGLIDEAGVKGFRQQFGQESATFRGRVDAIFPSTPSDALYPLHKLEAAVGRDVTPLMKHPWYAVGVDVGGSDSGDPTVIAIGREDGRYGQLIRLVRFKSGDAETILERVLIELEPLHLKRKRRVDSDTNAILKLGAGYEFVTQQYAGGDPLSMLGTATGRIVVDKNGIGFFLASALVKHGYDAIGFLAQARCTDEKDRKDHLNDKALYAARFRRRLMDDRIGLIDDDGLLEELAAMSHVPDASGKFAVGDKRSMRQLLGHSSDAADACLLCLAGSGHLPFTAGPGRAINL
jgi:hypothetical protein